MEAPSSERHWRTINSPSTTFLRGRCATFVIDEESIRFHARFQGVSKHMVLDVEKVARIFCKENNEGLIFPWNDEESSSSSDEDPTPPKGPPHLKVVK